MKQIKKSLFTIIMLFSLFSCDESLYLKKKQLELNVENKTEFSKKVGVFLEHNSQKDSMFIYVNANEKAEFIWINPKESYGEGSILYSINDGEKKYIEGYVISSINGEYELIIHSEDSTQLIVIRSEIEN